jgi:peptidyl-prolyl cis-trans isomerase C
MRIVYSRLRLLAREPLVHFILLGCLFWEGSDFWSTAHERHTIRLGSAERQRIAVAYLRQFGAPPTSSELQHLIDRYVREEIFLREGLDQRLDQDDEIVRRRIIQKYEFLQSDLATPESPNELVLERWYERHKENYRNAERISFQQLYFSPDKQGWKGAERRGRRALQQLRGKSALFASMGDTFPGPTNLQDLEPQEVANLFGETEFSQQLLQLPIGRWAGPYRSGYGWHLVYVKEHILPRIQTLAQVHARAVADYMDERRRALNDRAIESVVRKYTLVTAEDSQ